MEAKQLALRIAQAALDKQAAALEIVHVGPKVSYADYVIICSGRSTKQVDAIVTGVEASLKTERVFPLGTEGKETCQWVLMDYGDVIFNVFEERQRGFYDLDGLWIDADKMSIFEDSIE